MKIIERTFDATTGETTDIERNETAKEKAKREAYELEVATEKAQTEATAIAKAALLARLGITADEAKLLLA